MDAGVAAVLGAAIGGGLAGLTAIGTGWFALRVARLQVTSQESEAARQRRFEALQERRVPRQKAYEEFIDVGHRIQDLFENMPEWSTHKHLWSELSQRAATVAVVGPDAVAEAAEAALHAFTLALIRHGRDDHAEHTDIVGPMQNFAAAARRALEDDGNPEPVVSPPSR
ncbi:hypothetical protein NC239_26520 [Streptomyces sp. G3]|uniref:hypothetical protein n=1 Tax=unclassified Streptomyces TaxID=2593676 RepID=UPI00202E6BE7|nr:hypothetical protein [Streptomyces sp. G3]MCM1941757.1 hypothetical protein [Streptomyces sp. G3]